MKILYYDCFAGISGDMNLSALVDLGIDKNYIINELKKLPIKNYDIDFQVDQRKSITGLKMIIEFHKKEHQRVHFKDIVKMIDNSQLNDNVKKISKKIFNEIATAESKIHNIPIEKVHFHEVGAIDSIVDIVGCAIAIDFLKPDKIISSPIELGRGMVKCEHGILPIPAPATIEILKNVPITTGKVNYEATTPTGAAIIKSLVDDFTNKLSFIPLKVGYGIGNIDGEIPNVLRILMGNIENQIEVFSENAILIECNIDDMNPEHFDFVITKLLEAGAQDVFVQPIMMKKSRPAYILSVLLDNKIEKTILDIIFKETTTIGCRKFEVSKYFLPRKIIEKETPIGRVRIKYAYYGDDIIKIKPEYNDCVELAKKNKIPLLKVYEIINNYLKNE